MIKFSKCTKILGSAFVLSFIGTILSIIDDKREYTDHITMANYLRACEKEDPEFRSKYEHECMKTTKFKVQKLGKIEDDELL